MQIHQCHCRGFAHLESLPLQYLEQTVDCVQYRIIAKHSYIIFAFLADIDLLVFEYTQDFRNISVQANKLIDFGGVSDDVEYRVNLLKKELAMLLKLLKSRLSLKIVAKVDKV